MFRNKSVDVHQFSMVPRAEIPRSSFRMQKTYKTAFDAGLLIPFMVEEILPGDTYNVSVTAFCRLATPIFPIMDNLYLETFFFFVPNRLVWDNWERFMGEQDDPADSISFLIPQVVSPVGGYQVGSLYDYMGLPTVGQVTAGLTTTNSALPLRAFNLIYNEWFRDENLQDSLEVLTTDGPDDVTAYVMRRRGKRHDYFTSCLPWTQKGGVAVTIPLGTSATIRTSATSLLSGPQTGMSVKDTATGVFPGINGVVGFATGTGRLGISPVVGGAPTNQFYPDNLFADLSTATAATVNQLRQSFQIQKLLERDARGGSRYTEIVRSHFGVISPDARLQRPEYLGGGSTSISISPVAQTAQPGVGGPPLGNLSAFGTSVSKHGFSQSFTEHGHVIGICVVRADLTYQQGIRRFWSRRTRYDFYFPVFAALGEQAVLNQEIYATGGALDTAVFGYQERWAEYRYNPSQITGLMRSTAALTIDPWHLSQRFTVLPTLNSTFISDTPPLQRILAVGAAAGGQQLLMDAFFDVRAARPLPMYSVPGLIDHF